MILENIKDAVEFLPSINLTLDNKRFVGFFRSAQEWLVSHIIGPNIEQMLETEIVEGEEDPHLKLRSHCRRVIAEKAFLSAVPEMDMQLTEAGFAVQENDQFKPASAPRVDRLLARLPKRISESCDGLVRYLLENSTSDESDYSGWRGTAQFKYLSAAFLPLSELYNRFAVKPVEDYGEYYAALPKVAMEMKSVSEYYVSREEVERLIELERDNGLLEIHRQAIECLCFAGAEAFANDIRKARDYAASARNVMLSDPDAFPEFKKSDAYTRKEINIDGGKTVNFL